MLFLQKKKTYKKVTELINLSTFTACQTIKRAATIQGDDAMLHLLLGVNDDLMAAEAKLNITRTVIRLILLRKSEISKAKAATNHTTRTLSSNWWKN